MREIGVFCGTFNPIHWGHLMLAEFARDQFKMEKVVVITSPNPPHRSYDLLDSDDRFELVDAACKENPFFQTSRIELDRDGPSYTVDTLRQLKELEGPDCRLNLLVGQDNLPELRNWHEADDIFTLARILVATRHHQVTRQELQEELPQGASFEIIDFMQLPVSSSLIRERIRHGKTIRYLVPIAARQIIETKGHYLKTEQEVHDDPCSPDDDGEYEGIPHSVTLDFVKTWVRPRNSEKRFRHTEGVAKIAKELAIKSHCDVFLAELGGWLHDACKETKDTILVQMARDLHVPFSSIEAQNGHLLHGPVAAAIARRDLGITHKELLAAIAEHTLGNAPMTQLSEILFLADCLEESRPKDYTDPIWKALDIDGEINFDKAIVVANDLGIAHLIQSGRTIHPRAVEVRNHYLARVKARNAFAKSL